MDNNAENLLPKKFIDELTDIPSVPQDLYAGIIHRIDRKRVMLRTVWAIAASLVVMVTAFQGTRLMQPQTQSTSIAEAAEELSNVNSYFNSEVYKEDDNSYAYYEETLYQE
jgi:hypothetical protein